MIKNVMTLFSSSNNDGENKHFFHEPQFVSKLDTRVNFIIECADADELEKMKALLKSSKKKITFQQFNEKWQEVLL